MRTCESLTALTRLQRDERGEVRAQLDPLDRLTTGDWVDNGQLTVTHC